MFEIGREVGIGRIRLIKYTCATRIGDEVVCIVMSFDQIKCSLAVIPLL